MSQHGAPPSVPTKQELMQRLGPLKGFARGKRKSLLLKFPTSEALLGASVDDIATVKCISLKKASEIRQVLHGEIVLEPSNMFAGKDRVVLWNTTTERKVAGAAAPTVDKADAWLAKHPHYQLYTGQDRQQKSELHVPEHCKLSEAAYAAYCEHPTGDEQQLKTTLSGYKLRRGSTPAQAASSASAAADEMCAVIARSAARQFGRDRVELQTLLGEELAMAASPSVVELDDDVDDEDEDDPAVPPSVLAPLVVLKVANCVLHRPIWVFTSLADEKSVLEVGDDVDPQRVVPLRLAQLGNSFFPAPLEAEADVEEEFEVDIERAPSDDSLTGDGGDVGGVQLPDIKEDLATSLNSVVALCNDVEEWSKTQVEASLDLRTHKKPIGDYQERLRAGDGLDAGLIGDNGVGKSTLVNLSLLNTMDDESTYAAALDRAPEAVRELLSGKQIEPPSLRTLLADRSVHGQSDVSVQLLSDYAAVAADGDVEMDPAAAARRKFDELESSIRKYAEVEGQARPKVSDFLLPCGIAADSTTALHTRVRRGGTLHALIENATVEELQQDAYVFVQLRRDLGDDDPDDLEDNAKKEELMLAWHTYICVKDGTVKEADLPDFADDAWPDDVDELEQSWSDVKVCEALREVVKSRHVLYLGGGTDLHLDRKHLHDLLWRLNDKEQLHRFAAKSVEVFVPAAVFEGGCSFVDLPGLNDVDGGCLVQTIEGLQRSGVVFVVLKKSLAVDKTTVKLLEESGLLKRVVQNNDIDIVFITNREMDQGLRVEHINSEEEAKNRVELELNTKQIWKKQLTNVNKKLLKAGESGSTEAEIEQIVQNTQCRTIYPMTHTAFKLNVEHAEAHKEQAEAIFSTSNVYWLLGLLEALNRDGYVRELEHIVTVALPELRAKLQSSLNDVAALNAGSVTLPEPLVTLAGKWLKQTRNRESAFGLVHNKLEKKVETLSTGTESYKAQLGTKVREFMEQDETVQRFLEKAETNQPASCHDLLERIRKKSYGSALKAIDPRYKGSFRSLEIMPVAFGSKNNQVSIDFQPLIDDLEDTLEEIKEVVIAQIVSSVDEAMSDAGIDTDMSVSILRESFATSDILSTMTQRFRNFFSARQHAATLKNGQPAEYFKKQAVQCRVKALNAKVLSQHRALGVQGVCTRIKSNLQATRAEWKRLVTSELEDFVGEQFAMLYNDLVGHKGLLKSLLRGFLQHVVQTSRMQGDDELQQHLRRFLGELQQHTNRAHAMWTRLIKRDDPEQLGRAAAQHVERRRLRQMIERRAYSGSKLLGEIRPQRMPPLELMAADKPCTFELAHTFAAGDLDQVSSLNNQVLTNYKRGMCKTGRPDLFSAFAMVVWGKRVIKEQFGKDKHGKPIKWLDALTIVAKQLRALCICQLGHWSRKPGRGDKLFTVSREPVQQYIARLESGDYNGDAFCLWQLAAHFMQNFVLWLPGSRTPIFFPGLPDVKTAHHLVVAADEKPTTDNPAASFSPCWFHFEDDRKIKFDASGRSSTATRTPVVCPLLALGSSPIPLQRLAFESLRAQLKSPSLQRPTRSARRAFRWTRNRCTGSD